MSNCPDLLSRAADLINGELPRVKNCELATLLLCQQLPCSHLEVDMRVVVIIVRGRCRIYNHDDKKREENLRTWRMGNGSCCSSKRSSGLASPPSWVCKSQTFSATKGDIHLIFNLFSAIKCDIQSIFNLCLTLYHVYWKAYQYSIDKKSFDSVQRICN